MVRERGSTGVDHWTFAPRSHPQTWAVLRSQEASPVNDLFVDVAPARKPKRCTGPAAPRHGSTKSKRARVRM